MSEWRPLAVESLALDLADLILTDGETFGDELARLGDRHRTILGIDERLKDFPATRLGKISFLIWRHESNSRTVGSDPDNPGGQAAVIV